MDSIELSVILSAIGAVVGTGAICLRIGVMNRGYAPCGAAPVIITGAGVHRRCGGISGAPWVPAALALVAAGILTELIVLWSGRRLRRD